MLPIKHQNEIAMPPSSRINITFVKVHLSQLAVQWAFISPSLPQALIFTFTPARQYWDLEVNGQQLMLLSAPLTQL